MKPRFSRDTERFYDLIDWDNIISISEASERYGISRRTLLTKLNDSKELIEGIDYRKIGRVYLLDIRSMDRVFM